MKKIKKSLKALLCGSIVVGGAFLASCTSSKEKFKIDFEENGATAIAAVEIESGSNYTLPTPTRDGYQFDGWFLDSSFSGSPVTSLSTVSANTTIYAKWTKLYVVNLEGANIASLSLKAGVNVVAALEEYKPSKANLTFSGWYKGNNKIADDYVMPEEDITLTAKFMQGYKDEYYYQSLDGNTYVIGQTKTGNMLVGDTHTSNDDVEGFVEVTKPETKTSVVIDEDSSKNVTKRYFDRKQLSISFNTNYPSDVTKENDLTTINCKTGESIEFPTDVDCDGYSFIGWSKSKDGSTIDIPYNYLEANLYGNEKPIKNSFEAKSDSTYYAVWSKGYVDMFGGVDQIFLVDATSNEVYIKRSGYVFKGRYFKKDNKFAIFDNKEEVLIEGKMNDDFTFSYQNESRASLAYTNFIAGSGVNDNIKMLFDEYNGIEIVTKNGTSQTSVKGTFAINEDYSFTATIVNEAGETEIIDFQLGTYQNQRVFQLRNEEEVNLGDLYLYVVDGATLSMSNQKLVLNGYGTATLGSTSYFYKYFKDDNKIELYSLSNGALASTLLIKDIDGEVGLLAYNASNDHVYENGNDTLTLDGLGKATYVHGNDTFVGYYSSMASQFGSTILTVSNEYGDNFKFMLIANKVDEIDPDTLEVISSNTKYTFEILTDYYKEYLYQGDDGAYYAPLLVIEDEDDASLYGFVARGVFQKLSSGKYSLADGKTTYVAETYYDVPADVTVQPSTIKSGEDKVDLSTIKSFTFKTTSLNATTFATYWYSYTLKTDEVINLSKTYTGSITIQGDEPTVIDLEIEFVANKAVVTVLSNGKVLDCAYTITDGVATITYNNSLLANVELQENTFVEVKTPYTINNIEDGKTDTSKYFKVDKNGVYTYYEETKILDDPATTDVDETETQIKEYAGTVSKTGKTNKAGFEVFKFKSNDNLVEFEFIELANGSNHFFAKKNDKYDRTFYNTEEGITIELDGYGLYAILSIGENSAKFTFTLTEDSITINLNNTPYVFDIDGEVLKVRGGEAGSWLIYENNGFDGLFIDLDGYGKAKVYTRELNTTTNEYEDVYIDQEAVYVFDSETGDLTLTYVNKNVTYELNGRLMYQTISNNRYKTFTITNILSKTKYVNEADYSILEIDEFANATLTKLNGVTEAGKYTIITDNLIYYYNNAGTDACIYRYNPVDGTIEMTNFERRGYYTVNFESLLFTEYGFAIFNNEDRFYYDIIDNNVTIYKRDIENPNANEFGFVATDFGSISDEAQNKKTYDGKEYYINEGFALQFNRNEDNKDKYPIISGGKNYNIRSIYFAPTDDEFEIAGTMALEYVEDGETKTGNYRCSIVREKIADSDEYQMYIEFNYIRFYLEASYQGIDGEGNSLSTYSITKMERVIEAKSATFYSLVQLYYQFTRRDMRDQEDEYGGVKIVTIYNEDGTTQSDLITSYFTERTNYVDLNGKLLNFENAEYKATSSVILVEVEGTDGYKYRLYLNPTTMNVIDSSYNAVDVVIITRLIPYESNGISGVIEQYVNISSADTIEANENIGTYGSITIGEENPYTIFTGSDGKKYVVFEEKTIVTPDDPETTDVNEEVATYAYSYYIVDVDYDTIEEEDEKGNVTNKPKAYKSVNVTKANIATYFSENRKARVVINEAGDIIAIYLESGNGKQADAIDVTKEEGYYTFKIKQGTTTFTYKVTIVEGVAVFELV